MNVGDILFLLFLLAGTFGIPVIMLAISGTSVFPIRNKFVIAIMSFFILYCFIVLNAQVSGYRIEQKMNSYDLDGNGSFSSEELTPEAEAAIDDWSSDTGRNFAPFTGFIFSFVYVTIFFSIAQLVSWFRRRA